MKIVRRDLEEVIRLNQKYYKSGDSDYLEALFQAQRKCYGDENDWLSEVISGITLKAEERNEPYETYYKVLDVLGFEIVKEIDNE